MHKDFIVQNTVDIPEIQCTLTELVHAKTGAQVMHIANDDPENLFSLCFQTLPDKSDGVAHILEHTVLCGSKKFPVKDPFFCMRRRSLKTFMNAMTGSDFTCYPAASQVEKDFYNILEVYLDAVFHPNLTEMSFLQEGHRLEFANNEHLQYKGVVFNEMKGALSLPSTRLVEEINRALFPDLTYGINSGGDPKVIPSLTHQQLMDFHKTYYHPGRCLFYFYGNMPLEKHLEFISAHALKGVEKIAPLPPLPKQKRLSHPKVINATYPISQEEETKDKTWIALATLTCPVLQQEEVLALQVLEIALLDTDASPLKKALLKSGLCTQVSSYIESDISEAPWVVILQGCNPEHSEQLETIFRQTLEQIAREGIDQTLIDNALHQLEFYRSEITGGHSPFGLSLFFRSALLKQHGAEPQVGLMIHSIFKSLRTRIAQDPDTFGTLIRTYWLQNPHLVRVTMQPDKTLSEKELAEEQKTLQEIQQTLTKEQKEKIVQQAKELSELQKQEEDLSVLPKLTLKDVPKKSRDFPLTEEKIGDLTLYHHDCFTNHIVYAQTVFPFPALTAEELPLARLMMLLMPQMGCGGRSYIENLNYTQAHTGGVSVSFALNTQVDNFDSISPYLYIQGKALHHKVDKLFPLLHEMITNVDFADRERIKEVVFKHYTSLENALNQNALNYAVNLSSSELNTPGMISNLCFGLPYYHKIRDLAHNFDAQVDALIAKLQDLQNRLLGLEGAHLILSCEKEMADALKKEKFCGLQEMVSSSFSPWVNHFPLTPIVSQGRTISSPVAFSCKVFNTVPYINPASPALHIAANLFDNTYLHREIREKGGAYGGGSSCNGVSGTFDFYAYRDPNIATTFNAFDEATQHILAGQFTEEDLEEAKLEMIQAIDAPIAPGGRAKLAYSWLRRGQTLKVRQAFRDKLLKATKKEVIQAVEKHILPNCKAAHSVVFAAKELIESENKKLKDPLKLFPV